MAADDVSAKLAEAKQRFREIWRRAIQLGESAPLLEEFLEAYPDLKKDLLAELVPIDAKFRVQLGEQVDTRSYQSRFSEFQDVVKSAMATEDFARKRPANQQIDCYRLLEQIGEGGFGEVWAAQQSVPVQRRVAVKIIKRGMDTHEVIARFEAERQALAMMDHPNVATIFDAGATDDGRPYFAMELVRGGPYYGLL